jgi:hypothetical protein
MPSRKAAGHTASPTTATRRQRGRRLLLLLLLMWCCGRPERTGVRSGALRSVALCPSLQVAPAQPALRRPLGLVPVNTCLVSSCPSLRGLPLPQGSLGWSGWLQEHCDWRGGHALPA